ncbi:predicted protein [Neisseria gonorrhoeae SK-93-1035]|nr:predicted protein [Neisseria gonorrhoeae SK-93-1035]
MGFPLDQDGFEIKQTYRPAELQTAFLHLCRLRRTGRMFDREENNGLQTI